MHETHPQKCFSGNTLEIFESYLEGRNVDSGIWFKTRRLVISNRLNDPEICDCYSLWLPLTDIRYETYDKRVLMEWSDCNHLCEERSGDSNLIFGYKYQPKKPNNKITVEFSDAAAAKSFIAVVICADLDPRFQEKSIILPGSQELYAFVVPKHYIPKHYVVHVLTKEGDRNELKLFIHRPDARLDVETNRRVSGAGPTLSVRFCGEVSTPNYISNITGKPSVEQGTEVKCEKAELVYTGYRLESPLIESDRVPHGEFIWVLYHIELRLTMKRLESRFDLLNGMEHLLLCCWGQSYQNEYGLCSKRLWVLEYHTLGVCRSSLESGRENHVPQACIQQ
jgi:hypothetical protein